MLLLLLLLPRGTGVPSLFPFCSDLCSSDVIQPTFIPVNLYPSLSLKTYISNIQLLVPEVWDGRQNSYWMMRAASLGALYR